MELYVGADWSATEVACVSGVADGVPHRVRGCSPSLREVGDLLRRVRGRHREEEVHVVLESGSSVWPRLFFAAGAVVHVVDGKQAQRFRESRCTSGAKDDTRDARSLWYLGQSPGHCPEPYGNGDPLAEKLERLGAAHERLMRRQTRMMQQLRSVLEQDMPLVARSISHMNSRWALDFFERFPTAWHLSKLSETAFHNALKGSGTRSTTRVALWEAVRQTDAPWVTEDLAAIVAVEVRALVAGIRATADGLQELDRHLECLLDEDERAGALQAIPGFGPLIVATILCFTVEAGNRDTIALRMGASPVFVGSGKQRNGEPKGRVRMRKSAPSIGRRMSYLLGRMVAQHTRWGRAMYADAMRRGQRSPSAYRRIARSMLRIVHAMLRDGTPYDEEAYIDCVKAKGVRWAQSIDQEVLAA